MDLLKYASLFFIFFSILFFLLFILLAVFVFLTSLLVFLSLLLNFRLFVVHHSFNCLPQSVLNKVVSKLLFLGVTALTSLWKHTHVVCVFHTSLPRVRVRPLLSWNYLVVRPVALLQLLIRLGGVSRSRSLVARLLLEISWLDSLFGFFTEVLCRSWVVFLLVLLLVFSNVVFWFVNQGFAFGQTLEIESGVLENIVGLVPEYFSGQVVEYFWESLGHWELLKIFWCHLN